MCPAISERNEVSSLILAYQGHRPKLAADAFVAPQATLIGKVELGAGSSVWYGSVLRGDNDAILVGDGCNIQDACVLHTDLGFPVVLGEAVSLGHGAVVHGARVADHVLIGMRAVVLNGCTIGSYALIAAGAVVRPGTEVPPGSLVAGVPARVVRQVSDEERAMIDRTSDSYRRKAAEHRAALEQAGVLP